MNDLVVALGLALILEGVLYALFPYFMRRIMAIALSSPPSQIRIVGLITAATGLMIIWLIRRH